MAKLRIAFYTDTFLPAQDGVVRSILNFRKELTKRGHEVYIFASGNSRSEELAKKEKNVYVVRGVKLKKYPQYNIAIPNLNLMMALRELNPDIIHAQTPFMMGTSALAIAKINKIPIVGTFHTMFTDKLAIREYASRFQADAISRYAWRYARFFYNRCNYVIAPTDAIKVLLEKKGIATAAVVPNGVSLDVFNKKVNGRKVRKSLQKNKNEKIILYLGRISREKRLETLLGAAKLLKNDGIRFVFGGAGPALQHYTSLAKRLGVSQIVDFVGFVSERQLPQYYAASDAFCIPSTFETQGMSALEALAVGKPVIGADSLALAEIIKNGKNGEKFKPGDSRSCATKIKKVLNNIGSYKEIDSTASQYSNERTTDILLSAYEDVLKKFTL